VAKKASGAGSKSVQDATSEAERKKREEQEKGSEAGGGKVQEPPKTLEELRELLLKDDTFLDAVAETPAIQGRIQDARDTQVHEQTLPLRQKVENLERQVAESTRANDPMMVKYQQLKEAGHYEDALALLEERQRLSESETTAEARGRRAGAQEILQAVAVRPEFAVLTQEDWRKVYADAAAEAGQAGRNYITVDEYVAHATTMVVGKEKENVTGQSAEELATAIKEGVDARLKEQGVELREEGGGPEDPGTPAGSGGVPTDEEASNMKQDDWNALPDETRNELLRRGAKMARG